MQQGEEKISGMASTEETTGGCTGFAIL